MMLLAAILIPLLMGLLFVILLWPNQKLTLFDFLAKFIIAAGIGLGFSSISFFIWRLTNISFKFFILIEIFLIIIMVLLIYSFKKESFYNFREKLLIFKTKSKEKNLFQQFLSLGFLLSIFLASLMYLQVILKFPHGQRDAFAIWNVHARFLYEGGANWTDCLTNNILWFHPDYPLLLPGIIARCWEYIGHVSLIIPIFTASFFTFAIIGLLFSSIACFKSKNQSLLAGLVLLGMPFYIISGAAQCADIPLGFFILATIVLFTFQDRLTEKNYNFLILAGIMTGFAAWTKNEGLLFMISIIFARFTFVLFTKGWKTSLKQKLWFMAGLLPVLAVIIYFKLMLAAPNDLFLLQNFNQITAKLTDLSRYFIILRSYIENLSFMQGFINPALLIAYAFLIGIKIKTEDKLNLGTASIAVILIFIGYFFIYLITPYNLEWHLSTSINRLFAQFWPTFIFLFFMTVRTPEEALNKINKEDFKQ